MFCIEVIDNKVEFTGDKVRTAVGAIIYQYNEVLLVHKVKSMNMDHGVKNTIASWDFPKGGVLPTDSSLEEAILRELREETGSQNYRIVRKFADEISFHFPKGHPFDRQVTVMFEVEYLGDRTDLMPIDEEIAEVRFYEKDCLIQVIWLDETIEFIKRNLDLRR